MGIVTARIGDEQHAKLRVDAKKNGRSISEELRIRLSQSECDCNGRGILGWHAGSWVYCTCRIGLGHAMSELSDKLQILADDLQTMPICESNKASRQRKEFLFDRLKAEHDSLERQWAEVLQ